MGARDFAWLNHHEPLGRRGPGGSDLFEARDLDLLRSAALESMDKYCVIQRAFEGSSSFGKQLAASTYLGPFPCAVNVRRSAEETVDATIAGVQDVAEKELILPHYVQVLTSDRIAIPGWLAAWQPNHTYTRGARVCPNAVDAGSAAYYRCIHPGTSGAREPQWMANGQVVSESGGTAQWVYEDVMSVLDVLAVDENLSNMSQKVVRVKEH